MENKREKRREYSKKYYQENREKRLLTKKKYREENKEKIKEYGEKYYQENKETIKEYRDKYREENKETINMKKKEKITCICGCVISKNSLAQHKKSLKHIKLTECIIID